jgi:hypothetical protein
MPRGQYDYAAANAKRAATIAAKKAGRKPARKASAQVIDFKVSELAAKPRLLIEVEFDDVEHLLAGKDVIMDSCKSYGTTLRLEAHGVPPVVRFMP